MIDSIFKIIGSIFSYAAAKGIDKILTKWMVRLVITWENSASKQALDQYHSDIAAWRAQVANKIKDQQNWWEKDGKKGNGT